MYLEELLRRPKYPSILSDRQENLGRGSVSKAHGNLSKVITKNSPQKMHNLGALNQQTFSNVNAEVFDRFILRCCW